MRRYAVTRYAADGSRVKRPTLSADQCHRIAWELARRYVEDLHHIDYLQIVGFSHQTDDDRASDIARTERQADECLAIIAQVIGRDQTTTMRVVEYERAAWRDKVREWTETAARRRARAAA